MALEKDDGGLHGRDTEEYGYNSVTYLFFSFVVWVSSSAMHFLLTPRLLCHIRAWKEHAPAKTFECPLDPSAYETSERWQAACLGEWKVREQSLRTAIGDVWDPKTRHWSKKSELVYERLAEGTYKLRNTTGEKALAAFDEEEEEQGDL